MPTKDYEEFLFEQLQDPEMAAEYLSAAIEEGSTDEFLLALRDVAEAHGGGGVLSNLLTSIGKACTKCFQKMAILR